MSKKISYATRDFAGLREELVNLTTQYYPDLVKFLFTLNQFSEEDYPLNIKVPI